MFVVIFVLVMGQSGWLKWGFQYLGKEGRYLAGEREKKSD
jgi:hypothetical protein